MEKVNQSKKDTFTTLSYFMSKRFKFYDKRITESLAKLYFNLFS